MSNTFMRNLQVPIEQKLPYLHQPIKVCLVPMQLSEKIVLSTVVWVTFVLVLSFISGPEVLLSLTLVGILVVRELTDSFTSIWMKA